MIASRRALSTAALIPLALACSSGSRADTPASGQKAEPAAAGATVVAELAGKPITLAELDEQVGAANLASLRQQEYDLRRAALDELLEKRLFELEAKKRGISVEALVQQEVDAKAAAADRAEAEMVYARNAQRVAGLPKDQVMADIERQQTARNRAQRRDAYRQELIKASGVKLRLEPPRFAVSIPAGAPTLGPANAPVTIVEFADYQCPFCFRAQQTIEKLLAQYPNQLRLVHRDYPLDSIHPRAIAAAAASRCAGEQGKFWEYHKGLLAAPPNASSFPDEDLKQRAAKLGLDAARFATCLADPAKQAAVRADAEEGGKLGVASTPTFFINGRRVEGAKDIQEFVQIIEEELARRS